jgi:hypothetical protein
MVVVAHEAGHQREIVGRTLAARIAERQHGHVELSTAQGIVLLPRGEERARGIDGDLEAHIGLGHAVGDDLRDLVANILRGPLVGQAQLLRGGGAGHQGDGRGGGNECLFHWSPPKTNPRLPIEADSLSHAMFFRSIFLYTIYELLRSQRYLATYKAWSRVTQTGSLRHSSR